MSTIETGGPAFPVPSISDIRKRLEISQAVDKAFDDDEPNWYGRDIKTLLDLIDRMKPYMNGYAEYVEHWAGGVDDANVENIRAILKELEQ